jgi:hypothetical protein
MFRFTIRDVLWLTVVAGLALGWWADRRYQDKKNYRTEMFLWRFRAEALRRFIEVGGTGTVASQKGSLGREEVHVIEPNGSTTFYFDNYMRASWPTVTLEP